MRKPITIFSTVDTLLKTGKRVIGSLGFNRVRTVTITARATFHASATSAVRLNVYFSPNGKQYDTVPFAKFDIDLTAGATAQETKIFDMPENGFMNVEVENLDTTYDATEVWAWATVQNWEEGA